MRRKSKSSSPIETLKKLVTERNIAYGATSFGASLMGSIFNLYRVDLFTSVYKLDASYFYACQVVYALWNAINDPLFGWIIDHSGTGANKRLPAIKYGGPMWAVAFLLPWWPWAESGTDMMIIACQFCFCLCAYDTFLTYVLLVHCAMFADLTLDNQERNQLNLVRTFAGIAGSAVGGIAYLFWDKQDLSHFRRFCILVAFIAAYSFWFTGCHLKLDRMERMKEKNEAEAAAVGNNTISSTTSNVSKLFTFFFQITSLKNFWMYVTMNFMQNFNCTFNSSYWLFFVDKVVEPIFPPSARKFFIFASLYFGHE